LKFILYEFVRIRQVIVKNKTKSSIRYITKYDLAFLFNSESEKTFTNMFVMDAFKIASLCRLAFEPRVIIIS
jgi:hypothetical protein